MPKRVTGLEDALTNAPDKVERNSPAVKRERVTITRQEFSCRRLGDERSSPRVPPTVHITDHVVSRASREALACLLPTLGENTAYWKMLGYLAFRPGLKDPVILIGQEVIAAIEGKTVGSGYSAKAFLVRFERDVARLDLTPSSPGRCRTVVHTHWPEDVERLLCKERRREGEGDRVLLSSGKPYTRLLRDRERHARQDYALELMKSSTNPVSAALLRLLRIPVKMNSESGGM